MVPSLPLVPPLLSASATVVLISICIISFSMLSLVAITMFYIIWDYFRENHQSCQSDIESGEEARLDQPDITYDNLEWHEQFAFYQAAVLHNMRVLGILDRVIEELEERKELRKRREQKRALEKKLPQSVNCGSQESEINCKDCAICLDEFETGEMCQVLPSCNHVFHYKCINHWFMENLTCPICRKRVIEL